MPFCGQFTVLIIILYSFIFSFEYLFLIISFLFLSIKKDLFENYYSNTIFTWFIYLKVLTFWGNFVLANLIILIYLGYIFYSKLVAHIFLMQKCFYFYFFIAKKYFFSAHFHFLNRIFFFFQMIFCSSMLHPAKVHQGYSQICVYIHIFTNCKSENNLITLRSVELYFFLIICIVVGL